MPMLLDLERYRVIAPLEGHVGRVFSARFEAGEIFTAGGDGTAGDGMACRGSSSRLPGELALPR
jgi:hypothetical protein